MISLRDLIYEDSIQVDGQTISLIDFPDIWDLSDEEIEQMILQKTRIDIDSIEWIEKFNEIFDVSVNYLKEELQYEIPSVVEKKVWKRFSKKEDILGFFRSTKTSKGIINCAIARIGYGVHQVLFNERVIEMREKTKSVYENKLKAPLQINHSWKGVYKWQVNLHVWNWKSRTIYFSMTERWKTAESVIWKWTRDPEYLWVEAIGDLYGFTFTLEKKEDIPVFMQFISWIVFKRGIFDIKNKGLLDSEDIESNTEIREDFKKRLLAKVGIASKKKESADDYADIKVVSPRGTDDRTKNLSLEIKFTIAWNVNEKGLSMQWIYAYMRKITERIRLDREVSGKYIDSIVQSFIDNLETILLENVNRINTNVDEYKKELFLELQEKWYIEEKFNIHTSRNIDKYLKKWLMIYFREWLIVEKSSSKSAEKYTNKRSRGIKKIVSS